MKKITALLVILLITISVVSCKKSIAPTFPVETTPTQAAATRTAIALLTAGPSAQATATAQAQLTVNAQATLTAVAAHWTPSSTATATNSATVTPTLLAVRINAYLEGDDQLGGMHSTQYVSVVDMNYNNVADASVIIKNLTASTQVTAVYNGSYYLVNSPAYSPGALYEVDVNINGSAYTARAVAPGPASIDTQGNMVSWVSTGNNNSVTVDNPDSTQAFSQIDTGASNSSHSADISNVYAGSGQYGLYSVDLSLDNFFRNSPVVFAGSSSNSSIEIYYACSWDVVVSPGTQVAGTPTPTSTPVLRISANIQAVDLAGAITASEYVRVTDGGFNNISSAVVTIKDLTNATQAAAPYFGFSQYQVSAPVYVPGDLLEIDVYYNGVTYSSQSTAPGPASISADCGTITLLNCGNGNSVTIYNPDNSTAFSQGSSGNANGTSVIDVSNVYAASGQLGRYRVQATLANNLNAAFISPVTIGQFSMSYNAMWDVFVTAGTRTVGTPTPTPYPTSTPEILIYAGITLDKQYTGTNSFDYVDVYNTSYIPVSSAAVTLKDLTGLTQVNMPYNGYEYRLQNPPYIIGDLYEVDVFFNGNTYTAQTALLGPALIDAQGNTVTWHNGGGQNTVNVKNPDTSTAFSQTSLGASSSDMSVDISGVYALSGQYGTYTVSASLDNYSTVPFTGTAGNLSVSYFSSWNVVVAPGSRAVATPGP